MSHAQEDHLPVAGDGVDHLYVASFGLCAEEGIRNDYHRCEREQDATDEGGGGQDQPRSLVSVADVIRGPGRFPSRGDQPR